MIWRAAFVALLITVLTVACAPKFKIDCEEAPRVKNKSLGVTGSTRYGDPIPMAASC